MLHKLFKTEAIFSHSETVDKIQYARSVFWCSAVKRVFDVAFAAGALFILSPLMLGIALAIWLEDRGPILFVQERTGWNRLQFRMLKFRSMRQDACNDVYRQARRNDDRITRVGAVIRRTSLDELPQLINVLRGDMAIVGPRPHPPALDSEYADEVPGYWARYEAKPGLTGIAQIRGARGETPNATAMRRRVRYDSLYIKRASLLIDIKIIGLTFLEVFRSDAAF